MTARGYWLLALVAMSGCCAAGDRTATLGPTVAPPAAFRAPDGPTHPPPVPPPPAALLRAYEVAASRSLAVAAKTDHATELARLRDLNRHAQVAMAVLERTPSGPRRRAALARARAAVAELAAYLRRVEAGEGGN